MDSRIRQKKSFFQGNYQKIIEKIIGYTGVLFGSYVFAYAINALYRPFGFLSTGFNGVSMMLNYALGWPMPICSFVLNIVFVLVGFKYMSKNFAVKSIVGITGTSIFLSLTERMVILVDDPMIAIVFGGLLLGSGAGIAIRSGGALGGMNILGKIINKYFGISVGSFDMIFNLGIVFIAGYVFDLKMALYTIMARFVATKVIDAISEGFNKTKTLFIVSDKAEKVAKGLIEQVGRGVTYINSHGAYTGAEKEMIYCVVKLTQIGKVKEMVKSIDGKAFMSIIDTKEVLGNGFD